MAPDKSLQLETEDTKTLFASKNPDLSSLREEMSWSVLVAFDFAGVKQHF
tara:strand:+ start:29214 stop:29363 length:150 start_codon:yes stop_codon:yes gene_type:complete